MTTKYNKDESSYSDILGDKNNNESSLLANALAEIANATERIENDNEKEYEDSTYFYGLGYSTPKVAFFGCGHIDKGLFNFLKSFSFLSPFFLFFCFTDTISF